MKVQLLIENAARPGSEEYVTLCDNDRWAGGLRGTFSVSPDRDFPVDNLFLVLEKAPHSTGSVNPDPAAEGFVRNLRRQTRQPAEHQDLPARAGQTYSAPGGMRQPEEAAPSDRSDQELHFTLLVEDGANGADGPARIPVRSIVYGEHTISFYRQSPHQTV